MYRVSCALYHAAYRTKRKRTITNTNKKGILSLICGVENSVFDKSMHRDVHSVWLFTPLLRQSFSFSHPKKLYMGKWKIVTRRGRRRRRKEHFPLPALSAAPQIESWKSGKRFFSRLGISLALSFHVRTTVAYVSPKASIVERKGGGNGLTAIATLYVHSVLYVVNSICHRCFANVGSDYTL